MFLDRHDDLCHVYLYFITVALNHQATVQYRFKTVLTRLHENQIIYNI